MTYTTITLDVTDAIATVTLNRPDRMNACSLEMADEINDAVSTLKDARALVITGAGRGFCSGADLQSTGERSITGGEGSYIALTRHYNPLMISLARLNMPIICAVNGAAAGVGCSIALGRRFRARGANPPISCKPSSISGWFPMAAQAGCCRAWSARHARPK